MSELTVSPASLPESLSSEPVSEEHTHTLVIVDISGQSLTLENVPHEAIDMVLAGANQRESNIVIQLNDGGKRSYNPAHIVRVDVLPLS